ncbi:hypothetical protein V8C40DRAFT_258661 [Trichoderma camerunense]
MTMRPCISALAAGKINAGTKAEETIYASQLVPRSTAVMFFLFACLFRLVVPRRGRMAIRGRDTTKRSCRQRESMTCTPACTRTSAYACACTYEYSSIQPPPPPAVLARDWRLAAARIASLGRLAEGVLRIADLGSPRMSNSH